MESIYKSFVIRRWVPQVISIRNRHKHNITKPRLPHFERHVVEHVCVPYFLQKKKPQYVPETDSCLGQAVVTENNLVKPVFDILAKEALDKIISSKLIGFFHLNTYNNEEIFEFRVLLKKNDMKFGYYTKQVIIKALTGTSYEPVLQLFKGPTVMATSAELILPKLLKISKRMQKITLMAALVEDRLLSYSELRYYGQYENINLARVKLLQALNLSSISFVHQISHHPSSLIQHLNQRVNTLKKNCQS